MDWRTLVGGLAVLGIVLGTIGALVVFATETITATAYLPTAAIGSTAVAWGVVLLVALVGLRGAATKTTTYW